MALRRPRPSLLLPLALLAACLALATGHPWNPFYVRFQRQHVDFPKKEANNDRGYCNMMMWDRFVFWKYTNTFIHGSNDNIIAVCRGRGIPIGGHRFRSRANFRITSCTFNVKIFSFQGLTATKKIILTCWNGLPVKYVGYI